MTSYVMDVSTRVFSAPQQGELYGMLLVQSRLLGGLWDTTTS